MRTTLWAALLMAGIAAGDDIKVGNPKISAGTFGGQASYVPWSGIWWPMKDGELAVGWNGSSTYTYDPGAKKFDFHPEIAVNDRSPLAKYDEFVRLATGTDPGAALHELTQGHYVYGDKKAKLDKDDVDYSWWGHCNGWAAAAALEAEPIAPIEARGIRFDVADLKGLLSESHYSVYSDFTGRRYEKPDEEEQACYGKAQELLAALQKNAPPPAKDYRAWYEKAFRTKRWTDGKPVDYRGALEEYIADYREEFIEAFEDLRPDVFHAILLTVIGQQKSVVVFDTSADEEVWNYPAYKYETTLVDRGVKKIGGANRRVFEATTTVHFATDGVGESVLGTESFTNVYTYELHTTPVTGRLRGGAWLGGSVKNHPDFAWFPKFNALGSEYSENPKLLYSRILEILPQRHGARDESTFVLAADGVASAGRRGDASPVTYATPVETGPQVALSVTSSIPGLAAVKYFEQKIALKAGSLTAGRGPLSPVGEGTTFAATLAPGKRMIVAFGYAADGRLLALDEITVDVKREAPNVRPVMGAISGHE